MSLIKTIEQIDGSTVIETVMGTKHIRTSCNDCAGSGKVAGKRKRTIHCKACRGSGLGKWVTLTSFDGERWVMDARREQVRVERADRLHPGYIQKFQKPLVKDVGGSDSVPRGTTVRISGGVAGVKELPVLRVPGAWKRKNPPAEVKRASLKHEISARRRKKTAPPSSIELLGDGRSHYHRCEGHRFVCRCEKPMFRRLCGGNNCLRMVEL